MWVLTCQVALVKLDFSLTADLKMVIGVGRVWK